MALAAWSLKLGACSLNPQAWSLQLLAVDPDPWTKALPVIAHDLELSCDGLQLTCGGVTNFYCEFFHVSNQPETTSYSSQPLASSTPIIKNFASSSFLNV